MLEFATASRRHLTEMPHQKAIFLLAMSEFCRSEPPRPCNTLTVSPRGAATVVVTANK